MNMTNEVRTAAYTLMQRHLTEPFANDEERRLVLRQADDACEILAAWLDAQPAAPEPDWTLFDGDDDPPDCFIMSPWGNTLHYFHTDDIDEWWGNMPDMEAVYADSRMIVDVDQSTTLGVDWRTTLRRRPEVKP